MLKTYPLIVRILAVIGFFLVAGFILSIVGAILSGLLGLFFRLVIPLAIVYFFVNWLTKRRRRTY
ncbi:hypothetical protein [Enterococcus hermanniensis]|uniref:Uncharacterized protein n=1 Tax=Enterococcus hermanniensis TaxID=249189 RepID=A0A1L8TL75_9ENTE|nr:hypothetical protein [Enterococcus hermanniensis]OJG44908.1 hypothetical protein RV04_GL000476 [Enterococcus hermanniensis]